MITIFPNLFNDNNSRQCENYKRVLSSGVSNINPVYNSTQNSIINVSNIIQIILNPFYVIKLAHEQGFFAQLFNINWNNLRSIFGNDYRTNGEFFASMIVLLLSSFPLPGLEYTSFQEVLIKFRNLGYVIQNETLMVPPLVDLVLRVCSSVQPLDCKVADYNLQITNYIKFADIRVALSDLFDPTSSLYFNETVGKLIIRCINYADGSSFCDDFPPSSRGVILRGKLTPSVGIPIYTQNEEISIFELQKYWSPFAFELIQKQSQLFTYTEHPVMLDEINIVNFYQPYNASIFTMPCLKGDLIVDGNLIASPEEPTSPAFILSSIEQFPIGVMQLLSGVLFTWSINSTSSDPSSIWYVNVLTPITHQQRVLIEQSSLNTGLIYPVFGVPSLESEQAALSQPRARQDRKIRRKAKSLSNQLRVQQPAASATSAAALTERDDLKQSDSATD